MSHQECNRQKDAMETGEMYYDGQDYQKVTKPQFQINADLKLLCQDADIFWIHDMVRKIIPQNLKTAACLRYLDKAGDKLHD